MRSEVPPEKAEEKPRALETPPNDEGPGKLTSANVSRLVRKHALLVFSCLLTVISATFFWTIGQPRLFRSEAVLRLDANPPRPLGNRVELISDQAAWWNRREFFETELRVMRSTRVASATVRQLSLHADPTLMGSKPVGPFKPMAVFDAAKVIAGRISVEPVKDSSLVMIRYDDTDPARAVRVLSTHVRIYLDQNLEQTAALSTTALEWLNDQLGSLKDDLERSEHALSDFRLKNNVLSLSLEDRHNLITSQLEAVIKEITALEIRRIELAAKARELAKTKTDDPLSAANPDLLNNEVLAAQRATYSGYLKDIEELSVTFGVEHPKVLVVKAKLDATKKAIETEIKNVVGAAASELRAVDARLGDLKKKDEELQKQAHEIQQFEVPFNQLMRTKVYNEKIYGLVLERARETNLTRMMNFNNIRIVEEPTTPGSPFKPVLSANLVIGALAGLVLGIGLSAAREVLDQSFKTPNEIESVLNVTCLGLLPEIDERSLVADGLAGNLNARDTYVALKPESSIAEAVRVVRTNLTFMSPDRPYRSLVITSALPEEGKTTVSSSLAIALAQSGHRVVLIDADLRRPRLHRTYGVSNDIGVSVAVTGEVSTEEAIRETDIPNLSIITSGPTPPNPAEMLLSARFREFIEELKTRFDRIIIDSPPALPVTDSAILSQLVDGTVVVVRGFRTPRAAVRQALRRLHDVNGHLVGVVLNAVNLRDTAYKGHYYYTYRGGYYGRKDA